MNEFLPTTETTVPIVRAPGEGRVVGVLGSPSTFKVEPAQTGGAYAVVEQVVLPGHGPPLHLHQNESEIFYILEGDFEFTVGQEKIKAPPGTLLVGPRDIPHTFRNVGDTPGKLLLTILPGHFANFFREVDKLVANDHAEIEKLLKQYDVKIVENP